jgi:hypothetical protein
LLAVSIEKESGATVRPEGIPDIVTAITPGGEPAEPGLALIAYESELPTVTRGLRVPGAWRRNGYDEPCCCCVTPPPPQAANVSSSKATKAAEKLHAVHLASVPMRTLFIGSSAPHGREVLPRLSSSSKAL